MSSIFDQLHKEGPTWVVPSPPKPYYTCSGCKHFEQDMACSRGTPTYYKYCMEPSVVGEGRRRRRDNPTFHGEPLNSNVTPEWCPLLPKEDD